MQRKHVHDVFELANVFDYNLITEMHGYQSCIITSRTNVGIVLKMHIADAVKAPIIISCKSVNELIHQHANQML